MDMMPIAGNGSIAPAMVGRAMPFRRDADGQVPPAEIARQFEQIFVQQLMREMSKSLDGGFFGSESGSHVYEGLFEEVIAEKITEGRGIGIAPAIERSLGDHIRASQPEKLFLPGAERKEGV